MSPPVTSVTWQSPHSSHQQSAGKACAPTSCEPERSRASRGQGSGILRLRSDRRGASCTRRGGGRGWVARVRTLGRTRCAESQAGRAPSWAGGDTAEQVPGARAARHGSAGL